MTGTERLNWILGAVLAASVVAGGWGATCPCGRVPGLTVGGQTVIQPVTDWQFVNEAGLCQLQIGVALLPYAINLSCMAAPDGTLFIGCWACEGKFWSAHVAPGEPAWFRVGGQRYPVTLTRVTEPARLDQAWGAWLVKRTALAASATTGRTPPPPEGSQRPATWWSFQVRSRSL